MLITCIVCEETFDPHSRAKRIAGGMRNHCVDCCEETSIRYAGISAGEGKQAAVQVLKFNSSEDRAQYLEYWKVNSGLYKNKGCQIGRGLKSTPNIQFETKATFTGVVNHKGKA